MSASPFELFRRNLKPLMIALMILAMISFVVLPAVDSWMRTAGPGPGGRSGTVASYKGGDFQLERVDRFTRNHYNTVQFLLALAERTIELGGMPAVPGFDYDTQQNQVTSLGINSQPSKETSVTAMVYANRAREMGLDLQHSAIDVWLRQFSDEKLSEDEILLVLRRSTERQLGQHDMREQLRTHLLANVVQQTTISGLIGSDRDTVPPAQKFDLFLRLNRRAKVVAFPVLVDDYLAKVGGKPTEKEIKETYEAGKDKYVDEDPDVPGFRQRQSATFEVVWGNFTNVTERLAAEIPEDQLKAEYDRQVADGAFVIEEEEETAQEETAENGQAEGSVKDGNDDVKAEQPEQPASEGQEPPMTEQPSESAEPKANDPEKDANNEVGADEVGADDSSQPESSSDAAPQAEQPPADDGAGNNDSAHRFSSSTVRLVAFQEAAAEPTGDDGDSASQPASDASEAEVPDSGSPDADADASDVETPAQDNDATADDQPSTTDADAPMQQEPADPADAEAAPQPAPAVRPFEEVRQQIAEQLATPQAFTKVREGIEQIGQVMKRYSNDKAIYDFSVEDGTVTEDPPERPNLRELAERLGLEYEEIGPHDIVSIQETAVGGSMQLSGQFQAGASFPQLMFGTAEPDFSPVETMDFRSGSSFVSWRTEQTPDRVPPLVEVEEEVVAAIQNLKARALARAAAEDLADKANKSPETPLADLVPEDRREFVFTELGEFPWMLWLGPGRMPMVWNLEQLNRAGEDFMRVVFTQPLGQHGVAANETRTVYYVVQTVERTPEVEQLQKQFMQASERGSVRDMVTSQTIELNQAYQRAFVDQLGLKFNEDDQE